MKKDQINSILSLHKAWLAGEDRGVRANLSGQFLRKKNLRGTNFAKADLSNADLKWAKLDGADLRGADLTGAKLNHASLVNSDLTGARLIDADTSMANMNGAILKDTIRYASQLCVGSATISTMEDAIANAGEILSIIIHDISRKIRQKEAELHEMRRELARLTNKPLRKKRKPRLDTPLGTLKMCVAQLLRHKSAGWEGRMEKAKQKYAMLTGKDPEVIVGGMINRTLHKELF